MSTETLEYTGKRFLKLSLRREFDNIDYLATEFDCGQRNKKWPVKVSQKKGHAAVQIYFSVSRSVFVTLSIYDTDGNCIEVLFNDLAESGYGYSFPFDFLEHPRSLYFVQCEVNDVSLLKRFLVVMQKPMIG